MARPLVVVAPKGSLNRTYNGLDHPSNVMNWCSFGGIELVVGGRDVLAVVRGRDVLAVVRGRDVLVVVRGRDVLVVVSGGAIDDVEGWLVPFAAVVRRPDADVLNSTELDVVDSLLAVVSVGCTIAEDVSAEGNDVEISGLPSAAQAVSSRSTTRDNRYVAFGNDTVNLPCSSRKCVAPRAIPVGAHSNTTRGATIVLGPGHAVSRGSMNATKSTLSVRHSRRCDEGDATRMSEIPVKSMRDDAITRASAANGPPNLYTASYPCPPLRFMGQRLGPT
jgi:hypothetical protein